MHVRFVTKTILKPRRPVLSRNLAPVVIWFREDLRLADNPAVFAAADGGRSVICLYIHDEAPAHGRLLGAASKWWLDKSLKALAGEIERLGGQLTIRAGDGSACLEDIINETGADTVVWNRRYGAAERAYDAQIKTHLKSHGVSVKSFNARLLVEPWALRTGSGGHYRVFTPFWKALQATYQPSAPLPRPKSLAGPELPGLSAGDLGLQPTKPDWSKGFHTMWTPGEAGARSRLAAFLDGPIDDYPEARDLPGLANSTSGLSPHLRFGEIGPAQIWRAVKAAQAAGAIGETAVVKFLSEIAWREFSYVLLYHRPDLAGTNYNPHFDHMPWRSDQLQLKAWQKGQTGYPIVDAGMRQLWRTGWMHNRVRMICASFLTKHLLLHWREGETWFWDTLVDADPASNPASWQWTAGSGADAAPYFRVFNPITQGQKFDADGAYVRHWCPEIAALPDKYLHAPWTAPREVLLRAGVELGTTYPEPIIAHELGRKRALEAYETLRTARENV